LEVWQVCKASRSVRVVPGDRAAPVDGASGFPSGGIVFAAIGKLGLRLDAREAPVETVVVDRLEKIPTENKTVENIIRQNIGREPGNQIDARNNSPEGRRENN
jgi:hypothetical protein